MSTEMIGQTTNSCPNSSMDSHPEDTGTKKCPQEEEILSKFSLWCILILGSLIFPTEVGDESPRKVRRLAYRYFLVNAKFVGSKRVKDVKSTVIKGAEKFHARLNNRIQESVYYPEDSDDLLVHLLFDEEKDAFDFLAELSALRSDYNHFHGMVEFEREVREVMTSNEARMLVASETEEVEESLSTMVEDDFPDLPDLPTEPPDETDVSFDPNDPLINIKSFENFDLFPPNMKLLKCYLASPQAYPEYQEDDDNIIFASHLFQNYFDGMAADSVDPEMALQYDGDDGIVSVAIDHDGKQEERYKIFIRLEFRHEPVTAYMKRRIRDCVEVSPLILRTHLFVRDKDHAKVFFDIKYKETQNMWAVVQADAEDS